MINRMVCKKSLMDHFFLQKFKKFLTIFVKTIILIMNHKKTETERKEEKYMSKEARIALMQNRIGILASRGDNDRIIAKLKRQIRNLQAA